MDPIYARCRFRPRRECDGVQLVVRPSHLEGRLINRCPHCRGPLDELSEAERRELREAQNKLKEAR